MKRNVLRARRAAYAGLLHRVPYVCRALYVEALRGSVGLQRLRRVSAIGLLRALYLGTYVCMYVCMYVCKYACMYVIDWLQLQPSLGNSVNVSQGIVNQNYIVRSFRRHILCILNSSIFQLCLSAFKIYGFH